MAQADVDERNRPGLAPDEHKELAEPRRKNRVLDMENEILNRAAAHFAKENLLTRRGSGSSASLPPRGFPWR